MSTIRLQSDQGLHCLPSVWVRSDCSLIRVFTVCLLYEYDQTAVWSGSSLFAFCMSKIRLHQRSALFKHIKQNTSVEIAMLEKQEKIFNTIKFLSAGTDMYGQTVQTQKRPLLIMVCTVSFLSLVMRKPVFGVCDQLRLKPACSADATSYGLEISTIASRGSILSRQRTTKALFWLHWCAGWSAALLFAYGISRFLMTWLIPFASFGFITEWSNHTF